MDKKNAMTIIFFSGTLDKAIAMLILSTTAASLGMDVRVFCTFWGLNFLKRGRRYRRKSLSQKMMELVTPKNRNGLPLSQLNLAGAGPAMMKKLMRDTKTPSLDELYALAREVDVKFYACSTSCGAMGLNADNMIDGVEGIVGAATFLKEAQEASINLFI